MTPSLIKDHLLEIASFIFVHLCIALAFEDPFNKNITREHFPTAHTVINFSAPTKVGES